MEVGGEADLCEPCQERRDKGWLAEEFVLGCVPCGVNTVDNHGEIDQWWGIPDPKGERWQVSVCDNCFDSEHDPFRVP
jgi:hypothetical protein